MTTNEEILKQLQAIQKRLEIMDGRLDTLEDDKKQREAIEKWKKENNINIRTTNPVTLDWTKIIVALLGILSTAIAAIIALRGLS